MVKVTVRVGLSGFDCVFVAVASLLRLRVGRSTFETVAEGDPDTDCVRVTRLRTGLLSDAVRDVDTVRVSVMSVEREGVIRSDRDRDMEASRDIDNVKIFDGEAVTRIDRVRVTPGVRVGGGVIVLIHPFGGVHDLVRVISAVTVTLGDSDADIVHDDDGVGVGGGVIVGVIVKVAVGVS